MPLVLAAATVVDACRLTVMPVRNMEFLPLHIYLFFLLEGGIGAQGPAAMAWAAQHVTD